MKKLIDELVQATLPPMPHKRDFKIGCIGAGFIMRDCQLVAYRNAGFFMSAISSLSLMESNAVAEQFRIKKIYADWHELVDDPEIEIIDIAVPPHLQLEIVRYACTKRHIKGILCQKPVAMSLKEAREIAAIGKETGIPIAVNSNMRYDQSMRALKRILSKGLFGEPVLATIEMRAVPHWQAFLQNYDKLEIFAMGIHHVDIFRYLFGDPQCITALCRNDPRTKFAHQDGIVQFTFQYEDGMMATSLDDVWAWPGEPCEKDSYIKWRVEGTTGMATGTIGWPEYPLHSPSTLKFTCQQYPGQWIEPKWNTTWFPDAFLGTMSSLLCAVEEATEPEISAQDNINTIACVESCYESIRQQRTIFLQEVLSR